MIGAEWKVNSPNGLNSHSTYLPYFLNKAAKVSRFFNLLLKKRSTSLRTVQK